MEKQFRMGSWKANSFFKEPPQTISGAMASPDGTIGLCLDSGEAGMVSLTREQALAVVAALQKMLQG
jgi:hypothetical protein